MTSANVHTARRNATVLAATGVTVGALFLFPTSTNHTGHRAGRTAAPAGVVAAPAAPAATGTTTRTITVNGTAADTAYGPVQVQLKLSGHRIIRARAIEYPQGSGRDREINSYAIPQLDQEVVQAQSAHIDTVSGATYTSDGYLRSLQAAIDAAHLG